ncbi:MAG: hypothetical protein A3I66_05665 [Burkholderiales bacterium RIFCSPLOWO2_02_FULL_57_36]|nr:MAG: hypothetical protein A3I66_05665 [Burkholderiales bacterium RIFCSPLOWO2_02_FULL_57_36]
MQAFFKQNFISDGRAQQHVFAQQSAAEITPGDGAIQLKKHQHLRMDDACGWTVHAMTGTVWITQDGDARDIVLEAGESFVLDRGRTAILSPLNEAQVALERGSCRKTARNRTRTARMSFAFPALRTVPV